jgi:hypothetical protein
MGSGFAVSFRSFQASIISGAMVIFTVYVFFGSSISQYSRARTSFDQIMNLSEFAPIVALLFLVLLVGSLYTTALEGVVDRLQRRNLTHNSSNNAIGRRVSSTTAPLSELSENRLRKEARSFYLEHNSNDAAAEQEFADGVVRDTLWMDGKLVGTALLKQYNAFRSQGEIEVAIGVLLAPTTAALGYSMGFNAKIIFVATALSTVAAFKLTDYGFYYYRRANSLIAHHIADGAILTPTMESMLRNNPKTRALSRPLAKLDDSDEEAETTG